jgi:hypothetical protein
MGEVERLFRRFNNSKIFKIDNSNLKQSSILIDLNYFPIASCFFEIIFKKGNVEWAKFVMQVCSSLATFPIWSLYFISIPLWDLAFIE